MFLCYKFNFACAYKSIPGISSYREANICRNPNILRSAVSTSWSYVVTNKTPLFPSPIFVGDEMLSAIESPTT